MTPQERAERDKIVAEIVARGRVPAPTLRSQLTNLDTPTTKHLHSYLYEQGHSAVVAPLLDMNRRLVDTLIRPKPNISAVELLERHRRMDGQGAKPGEFRVGNQEASRGPLMALTEPGVRSITVVCSPQMFKTLLVEAAIAYYTLVEPSAMLVLEPTDNLVKQLVNWKINKMIEAMPILKRAIIKSTTYYKSFAGGHMIFTNSGSDANLGMNTLRIIICDEIDKYLMTKSGPARILAEERASTFRHLGRFIRTCTPTTPGGDIWKLYLASDQRRYFIDCPKCQHNHVPKFVVRAGTAEERQCVRWKLDGTGRPIITTARYHCPSLLCDHAFSEAERMVALRNGHWRQTRSFRCANDDCTDRDVQDPVKTRRWNETDWAHCGYAICKTCETRQVSNEAAGFQVWRIHSMLHDASELAEKSPQIEQDPQAWKNNMEAEPYVGGSVSKVEAAGLARRIEMYDRIFSDRIIYATAGIDVQAGYLAVLIIAWGRGGEAWLVDYQKLEGDPGTWPLWRRMDHLLRTPFQTVTGRAFMVEAASIDTGGIKGNADMVYDVAERFKSLRYFPIKGRSEDGRSLAPIYTPRSGENASRRPYMVGTLNLKEASLRAIATTEVGPGFFHIGSMLGDGSSQTHEIHSFLNELTSEERIEDKGRVRWPKLRARNEAWDCFGYARHAKIAFEKLTGMRPEQEADRMGIPRSVPEIEKRFMDDDARAATMEILKQLDATGGLMLKPAHARRRPVALPMVYRKGQGLSNGGRAQRR